MSHCEHCHHEHHQSHNHEHHHEHHHSHHHGHGLRRQWAIIIAAAVTLIAAVLIERAFDLPTWQLFLIYAVPYLIAGHETLREAAEGLLHGEPMNEHLLMTIATLGAMAIGFLPGAEHEMTEAVGVMLFFQIGELIEGYAEGRSRDSITHLMNLRPDRARVERDGVAVDVAPEDVAEGETLLIAAGERVALDGVVIDGTTTLNTVALTGESMPRAVTEGDEVLSGCVNISNLIRVRVTQVYANSTVARIINLVEHAGENKSRSETFITRFARVYTPIVVGLAVLLALIPPLFSGNFADAFPTWFYRALMFLVVSCPCALVISVPLTFFGGIGGASRKGILVKGANFIDRLTDVGTIVFDKTGTLTEGRFTVTAVHPEQCDKQRLLHLAAHVERFSTHPIAATLRDAYADEATDGCQISQVEELAGRGIIATVGAERVAVGNEALMESLGAEWHPCTHSGTIVHIAIDNTYAGHIVINDSVKPTAAEAITALRRGGVNRLVMLTGDQPEVAAEVATTLHLDDHYAQLLPHQKVERLEAELARDHRGAVAFVGDGINDAPVLARADIGFAMGAIGSDAAIEAADVVIMDDNPTRLATAITIARRTLRIARQNVVLAIGIKVAVLILAALGLATMWMAVFADVGVTLLAVLNALRALRSA